MIKNKKFYKDVSDIADYYRKTKTAQRLNLIISVAYTFLILLFVIGVIYSTVKSGNINSLFGDPHDLTRRFDCASGSINDTVKSYSEAKSFIEIYGGSCSLYHISERQRRRLQYC